MTIVQLHPESTHYNNVTVTNSRQILGWYFRMLQFSVIKIITANNQNLDVLVV